MPATSPAVPTEIELQPVIAKLDQDVILASRSISVDEARFLVDGYYLMQNQRIRVAGQARAMEDGGEPCRVIKWMLGQNERLELRVQQLLDAYSNNSTVGRWARSHLGIGPVLAAGLLAHIDIRRANNVGQIYSFAGLTQGTAWMGGKEAEAAVRAFTDPDEIVQVDRFFDLAAKIDCCPKWLSRRVRRAITGEDIPPLNAESEIPPRDYVNAMLYGAGLTPKLKSVVVSVSKRPWNADLKTLCWKIGESFVKVSGNPDAYYGKVYKNRKALEEAQNTAGANKDAAAKVLSAKNFRRDTEARKAYMSGKLPPAHVHARAKRYAVKLFLSHWFHVAYEVHHGKEPPKPYIIAIGGHKDFIPPPNWPMTEGEGTKA